MAFRVDRIACLGLLLSVSSVASVPTVEELFRTPQFSHAQLSPDGRHLAAVVASEETRNLAVLDTANGSAYRLTNYSKPFEVLDVRWQNDRRVIFGWAQRAPQTFELRIMSSVDIDAKNLRQVGPGWIPVALDTDVLGALLSLRRKSAETFAIVFVNAGGYSEAFDLDPQSGRSVKLASAPGRHCRYLMDHAGVVRTCLSNEDDLSHQLLYRDDENGDWKVLSRFAPHAGVTRPVAFSADNRKLWVISDEDRDVAALREYDPRTGTLGALVFSVPGADVESPRYAADGHTLMGVSYGDDVRRTHYFDERLESVQQGLGQSFPGNQVSIVNWSEDEQRALVLVHGAREPGRYYLFDQGTRHVTLIADRAPWMDRSALSDTSAVSVRTRDGLTLHGFLTLPAGHPAKNLGLIVRTPGMPFSDRFLLDWDPVAQFFAGRGYAVLNLNPRGTPGYGHEFRERGRHEIGRKVLDDVQDAIGSLASQGTVDKTRVCLFGETMGAYNALMFAARFPDQVRCAISIGGVVQPSSLVDKQIKVNNLRRERSHLELAYWADALDMNGAPKAESAPSPLDLADHIKAAVFLAHGLDDMIAPYADVVALKATLERQRVKVGFYGSKDEGHGFAFASSNVEMYTALDAFMRETMPAN